MSIKYAILGILSRKPSTGYELKKIFEDSSVLYWSGNNNQIYKALLQMQNEHLVTSEVIHQDSSPSKKIYSIRDEGIAELKKWVISTPLVPEFKNTFLIQLSCSNILNNQELHDLLSKYENELITHLLMQQEKIRRSLHSPNNKLRESFIWEMISENLLSSFKNELNWVQETQKKLLENENFKEN